MNAQGKWVLIALEARTLIMKIEEKGKEGLALPEQEVDSILRYLASLNSVLPPLSLERDF